MGFGFSWAESGGKETPDFGEVAGRGVHEAAKSGKDEIEGVDLFAGVQVHRNEGQGDEAKDGEEGPEEGIEEGRVGGRGVGDILTGPIFQTKKIFQCLILTGVDHLKLSLVKLGVVFQLDAVDKVGKGNGAKVVANRRNESLELGSGQVSVSESLGPVPPIGELIGSHGNGRVRVKAVSR